MSLWEYEKMWIFKEIWRRFNNKDVVPMLEVVQRMVNFDFYHKRVFDMLKRGCTGSNPANVCFRKSNLPKNFPFTQTSKQPL